MTKAWAVVAFATGLAVVASCGDTTVPTDDAVATVSVEPGDVGVRATLTRQLTAIPRAAGGYAVYGHTVTWSSADDDIATVSATGLVTGMAVGTVDISAHSDGRTGTVTVTVTSAPVASVEVVVAEMVVDVDETTASIATSTDAQSIVSTTLPTMWSSSNTLVATVSSTGVVTGKNPGRATIIARVDGVDGSADIRVNGQIVFATVSTGRVHSCGLSTGGVAYCWGDNQLGEIGDGTYEYRYVPAAVVGNRTFASIAAGQAHTCALTSDGVTYCWGSNVWGQLGVAGVSNVAAPVAANTALRFDHVSARGDHACGLVTGVAYCWGSNSNFQLGTDAVLFRTSPQALSTLAPFFTVAVGLEHSCGVNTGVVKCWGRNSSGELGNASTGASTAVPQTVSGAAQFDSVTLGGKHTCGLVTGGAVACWGDDTEHQLGDDGVPASRNVPGLVAGSLVFTTIAAGASHTCGLIANGSAYCWGSNADGRIGDGSETPRPTPTLVTTNVVFSRIASGGGHSCAIAAGGIAYCWGRNDFGQLGDSTTFARNVPVRVWNPY